jgi:hypothetical protein
MGLPLVSNSRSPPLRLTVSPFCLGQICLSRERQIWLVVCLV